MDLDESVAEEALHLPDCGRQPRPLVLLLLGQAGLRVHHWGEVEEEVMDG